MPLTLMYITNNVEIASIAQRAGVDRIWVDMEYIDKEKRQGGLDTVKSHHTVEDIKKIRPYVTSAELLVRINPIHDATDAYCSTEEEIEQTIAAGADVIMLPMFKNAGEAKRFLDCVNGRAKTILLFETAEAVENVDEILALPGVDEVHIGLNDLHLAYKMNFMFELLCDGTVKKLCEKFKARGLKYGFGGIARVGFGMLPAEHIITEHYSCGSTAAILSRGFCDANKVADPKEVEDAFIEGVRNIRLKEKEVAEYSNTQYEENLGIIKQKVKDIIEIIEKKKQASSVSAKKICIVTTVSITMKSFVVETAKYLFERCGYNVTLICNNDDDFAKSLPKYIRFIPVKMARGIDFSALSSISELKKIFKRERFDLVQYSTPNASFYASIAAKSAKVEKRLYCQWGIRYVGLSGIARKIFKMLEKTVCKNSTHIRAVSHGNMQFSISEGLYAADKVKVIGNGGTIGVDMDIYDISRKNEWRAEIRDSYGLKSEDFVFGFAGRVSADKGCTELFKAFKNIFEINKNAKLLIVGPMEKPCGVDEEIIDWAMSCENVISVGQIPNREMCKFYAAMNVLVHPTYREGFGMVIQEAGAMAIPTITTNIIGASEVMVGGESCMLVEAKNHEELQDAMIELMSNEELLKQMGKAAYDRTEKLYSRPIMLENQKIAYTELLK